MNYELAKQLKDAGFPQERKQGWNITDIDEILRSESSTETAYAPTLSELIEACGDDLFRLEFTKLVFESPPEKITRYWEAVYYDDENDRVYVRGISPEEAVANLWLAINKKK